jgi:NAD(P)H dehydrogenase (quinone)
VANSNRILVILASPNADLDTKPGTVNALCKTFSEKCLGLGLKLDLIDLYKDEFDPVYSPEARDSKILEYQIKIRKADLIVIFHPIWWGGVPAVLKGFLDKVLVPGFAYRYNKNQIQGLLEGKEAWVIAVSELPAWHQSFIFSNSLMHFWQRAVFDICQFKSKFILLGGLRTASQSKIDRWQRQMAGLAERLTHKESFLDLF